MNPPPRAAVLVSDFDGTVTKHDFFDLALKRLLPPAADALWQDYLGRRLTHFETLAGMFRMIRCSEDELWRTARDCEPDPRLAECVGRLRSAGWDVVIASAGCDWYIRRLLAHAGVSLDVHSNPGRFSPAEGLVMSLPTASPYFGHEAGIDKTAVVRAAQATGVAVAFAGDGRTDVAPARLVPDRFRFARWMCADQLRSEGVAFRPFERWSDIAEALLNEPL